MNIERIKTEKESSSTQMDEAMVKKGTTLEQLYGGYFGSAENCAFVAEHIPSRLFSLETPTIVDVGASQGTLGEYVREQFLEYGSKPRLILVDLNESALHNSEVQAEKIVSDAKRVPLQDASVDIALLRSVLHYESAIENQKKILEEMYRILIPGGILVSQFGSFPNEEDTDAFNNMFRSFGRDVNFVSRGAGIEMHKSVFSEIAKITDGPSLTETMDEFAVRMSGQVAEANTYISEHLDELKGVLVNPVPPYAWRVPFTIVSCAKK